MEAFGNCTRLLALRRARRLQKMQVLPLKVQTLPCGIPPGFAFSPTRQSVIPAVSAAGSTGKRIGYAEAEYIRAGWAAKPTVRCGVKWVIIAEE